MRHITLFLILLLASIAARAQQDIIVEHYTVSDGLASNAVYMSIKDSDGFLWFATWHGLCSFDGTRFTPFVTRRNKQSDIPPLKIARMTDDGRGHIWMRDVDNHLYLFDRRSETFRYILDELKEYSGNVQVIKIQRMTSGNILVLTRDKCLYEASVDADGCPRVTCLFDSNGHIDPVTLKQRDNVLGETADRVYWTDRWFNILAVEKPAGKSVLTAIPRDATLTCCHYDGQYICVGTSAGEVYIIDTSTWAVEHRTTGMRTAVTAVTPLNGTLYVTTSTGLYALGSDGRTTLLSPAMGCATNPFTDSRGKIWMNRGRETLIVYNPADGRTQTFAMSTDSINENIVYRDAGDGGLFILSHSGEVWHYNHRTAMMTNVCQRHEFGGNSPRIRNFCLDSDGRLWLSSAGDGVFKISFPGHGFTFAYPRLFSPGDNTDNTGVRSIYRTRGGELWIGTRGGELYCIDEHTGETLRHFSDDIGNVYHIMEDRSGNLWFSTKGAGLIKATPDVMAPRGMRMTHYTHDARDNRSLNSNRVYYTYQDSHGRIWVCTFGGGLNLMEESGGSVGFRNKDNGMSGYPGYDLYINVRSVVEDDNGRLWIGTTDGLMSVDGRFGRAEDIVFETYRDDNNVTIADNDIFTLYKDSGGNVWMGTFGGGLHKITGYDDDSHQPQLKAYSNATAGAGDVVASIVEDSRGYLWICGENSLSSLQPGSDRIINYDRFAGFPIVHIEDNSSLLAGDGRVLIGCREGIVAFNPTQVLKENSRAYTTFITDIKVLNRSLADFDPPIYSGSPRFVDTITLKHDQNMFTIEYATLTFNDPERINYTYLLDGYEERWHEAGINRAASYANVPPGTYTFRVMPADGLSPERTLTIIILPPWWATWWAYIIYIFIGCALLYAVVRLILYTIRMRNEVYINDRLAELKIRFFTNVSHELRTPLTLIKGPIEELRSSERLTDTGREYLSLIDRNANKMLQLVNQILDFRKVQNGKMKMRVSYVSLSSMIETFRAEYRVMADERAITFRTELPGGEAMIWCDAAKMRIILGNLIGNAFKYTPTGGVIRVAASIDERRRTVTVSVEDNGTTIPKDQLEEIFERFSQADTAATGITAGTGIGLSLAREYVNMHHGRIWAENMADGGGVAFIIEMPIDKDRYGDDVEICIDDAGAAQQTTADGGTDEPEPDAELPTIVLAEDNADVCRMISLQLRGQYNVYTARNGEEGLEKVYRYRPDIIITDLMMPGIDGMELLRRVRKDFNISHTPVIILTAKHNDETMTAAVAGGANAYITKPFSSNHLSARIKQLIEEQRIFQRRMMMRDKRENANDTAADDYESHLVRQDIEFVDKIYSIIEQNITSDDFNINTIAESIGLSRSAFFKKLKSLTGFSPIDLVREIRLNKAADMLENTDNTISAIAYAVGFHDVGYFGKCFRQKYGRTPKDYRTEAKKT